MINPIQASELKPGDVLLYHGTSFVSGMIRLFDGSEYSHAAIYDGSNIAEAKEHGVVSNPVLDSIREALFVDVCRFCSDTGNGLNEPNYGAQPIIDRINFYVRQGDRYAYEEIVLLAFLTATRRLPIVGWIPGLGKILRNIFDSAAYILNRMIAAGKEPMICSELVYRCYIEAGDSYRIRIVGADLLMRFSVQESLARGVMPFVLAEGGDREAQEVAAAAQEFLHLYAVARRAESRLLAIPDFVTPRDIATSPNLIQVGRLNG